MPIVEISLFSGRSPEQKNDLAKAITEDFVRILKVKQESIQIIFNEVDKSNWAIAGQIFDYGK